MEKQLIKSDTLIKERVLTLSNQYFPIFQEQLERQMSFEEHLQDIEIDLEVVEFIDDYLIDVLNDHNMTYMEYNNPYESEKRILLKKLIKEKMIREMKNEYTCRFNGKMEDLKEEMTYAKEDEEYHEKRWYLKDVDFIGEVSEEERVREIEKAKNEQQRLEMEINKMEKIEKMLK